MSALGAMTLGARTVNRTNNKETLEFLITSNTVEWSSMTLTIPPDILDAAVEHIYVETLNAATAHVQGALNNSQEVCNMSVQPGVGTPVGPQFISEPIKAFNRLANAAGEEGWITLFLFPYTRTMLRVRGGDIINFTCPPADDNVAPAGDYQVKLHLQVYKYSRQ